MLAGALREMDDLGADFDLAWDEMPGTERQEIAVALVNEIPVTVIPGKRGLRWERQIGRPVLPEWLGRV